MIGGKSWAERRSTNRDLEALRCVRGGDPGATISGDGRGVNGEGVWAERKSTNQDLELGL